MLGEPHLLPRTRWVDEFVHRYLFEREICQRHESEAARFCETELTKELYFLGKSTSARRTRTGSPRSRSGLVERARAAIEAELFDAALDGGAGAPCHASESALLRAFAVSWAYRRRRMCASAASTKRSCSSSRAATPSGEVAERVGYRGQAAFAVAFHRKFHVPPSSLRRGEPALPCPRRPPPRLKGASADEAAHVLHADRGPRIGARRRTPCSS